MKKIVYSIIAMTVLLSACKYEEGPGISLRSKRDRASNEWTVEGYTYTPDGGTAEDRKSWYNVTGDTFYTYFTDTANGVQILDSTSQVADYKYVLITTRTASYSLDVIKTTEVDGKSQTIGVDPRDMQFYTASSGRSNVNSVPDPLSLHRIGNRGEWSFTSKHSRLQFKPDISGSNYAADGIKAGNNVPVIFDIVKLANDNLKLSAIDENGGKHEYDLKPISEEKLISFKALND